MHEVRVAAETRVSVIVNACSRGKWSDYRRAMPLARNDVSFPRFFPFYFFATDIVSRRCKSRLETEDVYRTNHSCRLTVAARQAGLCDVSARNLKGFLCIFSDRAHSET